MDCRGIGERSDAVLRTAKPGNDECESQFSRKRKNALPRTADCFRHVGKIDVHQTALPGHRHRRALLGRGAGENLRRRRSRPAGRAAKAALRFRPVAHQGDGRRRHRHAGDLARRAVDAKAAGGNRGRAHAAGQRSPARPGRKEPAALRRLRRPADRGARGRRRRARALRKRTRLQGCHDARPRQRHLPRRQEILADLRPRRTARRADLSASGIAAGRGVAHLLRRLRQGFPDRGAAGLGLYGGDRDHRHPARAVRRCSSGTRS